MGNQQSNCCLKSLYECKYGRSGGTGVWSVSCSLECPCPPPSQFDLQVSSLCIYLHALEARSSRTDFKMASSSDPKINKETYFWKLRPPTMERLKGHKCQHSPIVIRFCLDIVNAAVIWKPSSRLNDNLRASVSSRSANSAQQRGPPCQPCRCPLLGFALAGCQERILHLD